MRRFHFAKLNTFRTMTKVWFDEITEYFTTGSYKCKHVSGRIARQMGWKEEVLKKDGEGGVTFEIWPPFLYGLSSR